MKKETWKTLIQVIISILTAVATTLGVTSCMQKSGKEETQGRKEKAAKKIKALKEAKASSKHKDAFSLFSGLFLYIESFKVVLVWAECPKAT